MSTVSTQANQPLSISTSLGANALLLERLTGSEAISEPFLYQLELLYSGSSPVSFSSLLGQSATVTIILDDGSSRYINGVFESLTELEQVAGVEGNATYVRYRASLVPKFRLLDNTFQSVIYQQLSVPDILKQVMTGITISSKLQKTYNPRNYCVQYQETNFNFASRLMEDEGIFYYFTHTNGAHTMVLGDGPSANQMVPGNNSITYDPVVGGDRTDDRVRTWSKTQRICPASVTVNDYCFEVTGKNLASTKAASPTAKAGTVSHSSGNTANAGTVVYNYPGGYAKRYDGINSSGGEQASQISNIFTDSESMAATRILQELEPGLRSTGGGFCRQFMAGCKFTLGSHFDANGEYILTRVEIEAGFEGTYATATPGFREYAFVNRFECIPSAVSYSPPRLTPIPKIEGPQTAVVVGTSGQEIFTDKYGRVKVQFHWDQKGQNNAGSSCWIRVGSPWAGQTWGMVHIPRIGQEVIVAFLNGDPDQPIIVGSVYNATNMPPYTLPTNMTKSGLVTRSTLNGTTTNANELSFQDKIGSELFYMHAERNFTREVENSDSLTVGSSDSKTCPDGSQTIVIYKNRTETLTTGNEQVTIAKGTRTVSVYGNDTLTVTNGNRAVTISQGNDSLTVTTGNRTATISKGNDELTVTAGNLTISVNAGSITTSAKTSITQEVGSNSITISNSGSISITATSSIALKVGSNSITISDSGVAIQGAKVTVTGSTQVGVTGATVAVTGSSGVTITGGTIALN